MPLRRYSPPIERVKEEYARMIAHRVMRAKRGPRPEHPRTPDNSEPWIANPKTVDGLWEISECVRRLHTELGGRLVTATRAEAEAIFARYVDHVVAARALENPDPSVQALAREILAELAAQGDPFARDTLGL